MTLTDVSSALGFVPLFSGFSKRQLRMIAESGRVGAFLWYPLRESVVIVFSSNGHANKASASSASEMETGRSRIPKGV